jgi:hypothetical protein
MSCFVMEHLPRAAATYEVTPLEYEGAKRWLQETNAVSIIRTTEMIAAIQAGMGISLLQSAVLVSLHPGDEALLITLSFGVLLAWAEENMTPLPEDWRCALLRVRAPGDVSSPMNQVAIAEHLLSDEPA